MRTSQVARTLIEGAFWAVFDFVTRRPQEATLPARICGDCHRRLKLSALYYAFAADGPCQKCRAWCSPRESVAVRQGSF